MRARGGLLAIVVVAALVGGGGAYLEHVVGPRTPTGTPASAAPSGAWYCPHGGGPKGWAASLSVTNPGPREVRARITSYGHGGVTEERDVAVPARANVRVTVPAEERGSASMVEFFGGWVAASWVASAGGEESGVAAEPCASAPGRSLVMPDGTTEKSQDAYVVVMNPFDAESVFSLTIVTEDRTVRSKDWSNFLLPPRRTAVFHLNDKVLGDTTVAAVLQVSLGRVAASSLGIADKGGIRSAIGAPAEGSRLVLPGTTDAGPSEVPVLDPGGQALTYGLVQLSDAGPVRVEGLGRERLAPGADTTEHLTASGSAVLLQPSGGGRVAAARRSFGLEGDQGSTNGVVPRAAWLLSSAAAGSSDDARVFLANPRQRPVEVHLRALSDSGPGEETSLSIPAGSTVQAPPELLGGDAFGSVVAMADRGTFVPVEASYSAKGGDYAVAAGVPIPTRWIPAS